MPLDQSFMMLRWLFYPVRSIKKYQDSCILTYCTHSDVQNKNSTKPDLQYSSKDELQILQIINNADVMEVSRYNISKVHAEKLILHRQINGNFTSVCDLLSIKNIKQNAVHKFCNSIVSNKKKKEIDDTEMLQKNITPIITNDIQKKISSALAIHFCNNMITWACLDRDYTLLCWDHRQIMTSTLSTNIIELIKLTSDVTKDIPCADVYVIEDEKIPVNTKAAIPCKALQQQQIIVILLTQLMNHIDKRMEQSSSLPGVIKMFTLRHRLTARFVGLVLGNEVISAKYIIDKLINPEEEELQFVTRVPAITLSKDMKNMYKQMNTLKREQMGWALLKAITFVKALSLNQ